jgi:hypothetical protein
MIVNILYSLDEKGFDLFLVSLYSLLKNKHSHTKYAITITHNGLEQQIIKITQKLVDYFTNTTIRFIDCSY